MLRLWRCLLGSKLFVFSCPFLFLFLATLEPLELLLSLFLLLLLGLLDLLGFLREQDLDDEELGSECELFRPDAGELRPLPRGVLVRALSETFEGATAGIASVVVSSAADEGGPGGC